MVSNRKRTLVLVDPGGDALRVEDVNFGGLRAGMKGYAVLLEPAPHPFFPAARSIRRFQYMLVCSGGEVSTLATWIDSITHPRLIFLRKWPELGMLQNTGTSTMMACLSAPLQTNLKGYSRTHTHTHTHQVVDIHIFG